MYISYENNNIYIFFINLVFNKNLQSVWLINTSDEIEELWIPLLNKSHVDRCEPVCSGLLSTCCKLVNIKVETTVVCSHQVEIGLLISSDLLQTVNDKPVATCFQQHCCKLRSSTCCWPAVIQLRQTGSIRSVSAWRIHQGWRNLSSACVGQVNSSTCSKSVRFLAVYYWPHCIVYELFKLWNNLLATYCVFTALGGCVSKVISALKWLYFNPFSTAQI
jgi:hypothetical protein